jgi:segregation and condensation protein B
LGQDALGVNQPTADYSTPDISGDAPLTIEARLEALLFVSGAPVTTPRLTEALKESSVEVESALARLDSSLAARGLRLQSYRGAYSLTTAPSAAGDVARLLDLESSAHLTRAALETLSIIAYRQPATRPLIDSIRGVNSEASVHTLVRYGLVEEAGRGDGPGRPILYSTTQDFLQHFGLRSLSDLPALAPGEAETVPLSPPVGEV